MGGISSCVSGCAVLGLGQACVGGHPQILFAAFVGGGYGQGGASTNPACRFLLRGGTDRDLGQALTAIGMGIVLRCISRRPVIGIQLTRHSHARWHSDGVPIGWAGFIIHTRPWCRRPPRACVACGRQGRAEEGSGGRTILTL